MRWGPVALGVLSAVATVTLLGAVGFALDVVGRAQPDVDAPTRASGALGAVAALAGLAATAALALGGWVAARRARTVRPLGGLVQGSFVGASVLILALAIAAPLVAARADFHSIGIGLGLVEPDVSDVEAAGLEDPVAAHEAVVAAGGDEADVGWPHVQRALWYGVGLVVAFPLSAALAGMLGAAHGRVPRLGAVGAGIVPVTVAALTFWLWPSLWYVGTAVFDFDQEPGADVGINLTEVAQHPEVMWGERVTVTGRVEKILDSEALVLGSGQPLPGGGVLVLDLVGVAPEEDEVVRVTGVVTPFDPPALEAELGVELGEAVIAGYDGLAVLVAEEIDMDVPARSAAGDKEFSLGADGYDAGVTLRDVVTDPDRYLGERVTVSGEVEDHAVLTEHAWVLDDLALLVVSREPRPDVVVEATAYVMGEVRRFNLAEVEAELGIDLDDELFAPHAGEPVVIAEAVDVVK